MSSKPKRRITFSNPFPELNGGLVEWILDSFRNPQVYDTPLGCRVVGVVTPLIENMLGASQNGHTLDLEHEVWAYLCEICKPSKRSKIIDSKKTMALAACLERLYNAPVVED